MKKLALAALAVLGLALASCTTVTGQAYAGYEAAAKKGVQLADDNAIKTITDNICAVPYGAVIRNTQFIPVAKAACLPAGANSAPDSLLPTATPIPSSSALKAQ